MMSLVKIIDISGSLSLSLCQCEHCHIVVATPIITSSRLRKLQSYSGDGT